MTRPQLLELSPARAVWTVSWPMIAIGLIRALYFLTDSAWIGQINGEALIAVGGSAFAWWILVLLGEIAGTGAHSLVAQRIGARDEAEIPRIAVQALWLALGIAGFALLLVPLIPTYFDLLGFERDAAELALGQAYLEASALGAVAITVHTALGGVFRGIGDTRTVLWITGSTAIANAFLDPLLIWGLGPIPALGIAGAAWATVLANALGGGIAIALLGRRGIALAPQAPDLARMRRLLVVGLPVSARGIAFAGIYIALGRMITSFGAHQMAALGVGHRIESIPYLACVGLEVGCATLVGQHIGAGNPHGARIAARTALGMALGLMVPCTAILFFGAEVLFGFFASDEKIVSAGALYLRIQTSVFFFMALESLYQGAFTGTGRTLPAFWIGAVGTAIRLPLAAVLAWPLGLGATGIWIAIALSTAGKGVAMAWFFETWGLNEGDRLT